MIRLSLLQPVGCPQTINAGVWRRVKPNALGAGLAELFSEALAPAGFTPETPSSMRRGREGRQLRSF